MSSSAEYWEGVAEEFDSFYKKEKGVFRKLMDSFFRKAMRERFELTLKECTNISGKRILDIGCGSGRVTLELARRGAHVVGIDLSPKMINLARSLTEKYGLRSKCSFICDDFIKHVFGGNFDISVALGVFDYTEDPKPYLEKAVSITKEKFMASFSSKFACQVPIRKIWLKTRGLPVYFYTEQEIRRTLSLLFSDFEIKKISAGYFCVGYV